jgi:Raf kinase inhibitor-like YbhB/YbcL family protein
MSDLSLRSPAFADHGDIPRRHTCQGEDKSPPLEIAGVPGGAETLALIVEDPDAPNPAAPKMVFDHWLVWNIPAATRAIAEGTVPAGAIQGRNGWGKNRWNGPCPPIGRHRYFFRLYTLGGRLELRERAGKDELRRAMAELVLAETELVGLYQKS